MIGDLLAAWPLWLAMVCTCVLMACLWCVADRYRDDDERSVDDYARAREALRRQYR